MAALETYRETAAEAMTLEGAIRAFTCTVFEMMEADPGARNYGAIVAYLNSTRGELMSESFDAISHVAIDDMRRVMPQAVEEDIYWGYHFLTGVYTFSLGQTGRIDLLSNCK